MRIVVFGTGPFAAPSFRWLSQSGHDLPLVITRPIADSGRRRKTSENPIRDLAESLGLNVACPADVNSVDSVQLLEGLQADLFFVCDYGQILSADCLATARLGGINLHGSLLPKYRGAAPVNWAVYHGETVTGVTVIHMSPKLDAGPCLATNKTSLIANETAEELEPRLAELGVSAVRDSVERLNNWDGHSSLGLTQDSTLASKAPRLKKRDGRILWSKSALQIFNQVRAFQPWPGSFSEWQGQSRKPLRVILHEVRCVDSSGSQPGEVCRVERDSLTIQTGQGGLQVLSIQPAGKRQMNAGEFIRGYQPALGDRFVDA